MKDYNKMINPDNKRANNNNAIFGTLNNITDYHLLGNYFVDGKTLTNHLLEKDLHIKEQKLFNDKLIKVIEKQNKEIKELKERLDRYGI